MKLHVCAKRRYLAALAALCASAALLLADSVTDVRPSADGATQQWTNEAGTACSSADCYTEVNESSGANCTNTPGDSTDNKSPATSGQAETYDIDESGIPDDSTVQSAVVRACVVRGGTQNAGFTLGFCINGSCTNSGTLTSTSAYSDFSSGTLDFADDTKTAGDDYELRIATTQARAVFVTAIEADITYTPPASGMPRRVFITQVRPK